MSIIKLKKIIKLGHLRLAVADGISIEDAKEHYSASYPELVFATFKAPRVEGNEQIWEVISDAKVGTKG